MLSTEIDSHCLYAPLTDNTALNRKTRHVADVCELATLNICFARRRQFP